MSFLLAAALALTSGLWASADEFGDIEVQRYLLDLYLGDSIDDIETIYPPVRTWPSYVEPRHKVRRIKLQEVSTKRFPNGVDILWLGMKRDNLVEIQVVYDAQYSREKPAEKLAADIALIYGEPTRSGSKLWWNDGTTIMRVYAMEIPVLRGGKRVTEVRTCLQIMNQELLNRKVRYRS